MNEINQDHLGNGFPIIYATFEGDKPGWMPLQRKAYNIGSYRDPTIMQVNLAEVAKYYTNSTLISITFTEDEAKRILQPNFDALVVDLEIERHRVMRNLIGGGSFAYIIFTRALSQLNIPNKTLKLVGNPFRGFTGNEVTPLVQITLKVTFRTTPCTASVDVNFIVVDIPSVYNTIIGRVTLHAIRAVTSTYHMLSKFATINGIGVIDRAHTLSRKTYQVATSIQSKQRPIASNSYKVESDT